MDLLFPNVSQVNCWALAIGITTLLIIIFTPKISKNSGFIGGNNGDNCHCLGMKRFEGINIRTIGDLYSCPGIPASATTQFPR